MKFSWWVPLIVLAQMELHGCSQCWFHLPRKLSLVLASKGNPTQCCRSTTAKVEVSENYSHCWHHFHNKIFRACIRMYYVSKQHFSNIFAFSSVTLLNPKVRVWLSNVERVSTVEDDLHCSEEGTACSPSAAISSADGIGIQHLSSPRTCWTRSQNFKIRFKQASADSASPGGWSLDSHWVSRC